MNGAGGALAGLRVIETGHIISGPFCGHLFADHGAEVIKVEPPGVGDGMRSWGGIYKGVGLYWPIIGRGKKSVTIDLRSPDGQEAFRELARTADVVIENFRPGTFERWNLSWETLQQLNPALVMIRITGYGQTGPYRDKAGYGLIGEAMGGFRHLCGEPGQPPVRVGISIGDALAGTQGFIGALLALLAAARSPDTASGQVIDVALYEAVWMYMESILPVYEKLHEVRGPTGALLPGIAPSNVYPSSDGQWVVIGANQDSVFQRLAKVMHREEWLDEASPYLTHIGRGERQVELDTEIVSWTSARTATALLKELDDAGVPAGRVYTAADIATDAHFAARDMIVRVPEPNLDGEELPMPGIVPKLSHTPGVIERGAPKLGEHNDEILGKILGPDRLAQLVAAGTV